MKKKPNILVFMTDQQLGDTICEGNLTQTPNVDRLKAQGIHFTHSYCPAPHCCPSRATFFSGLYPSEHNVWNNVEVNNALSRGLYDGVELLPEMLKAEGYQTIFSGKWHVSGHEGPGERGFDEVLFEKTTNGGRKKLENKPQIDDWELSYGEGALLDTKESQKEFGRIVREGYPTYYQFGVDNEPFGDQITVERACKRLKTMNKDVPFFMYVGVIGPHDPYNPPQEFIDRYRIEDITLPPNFHDTLNNVPNLYKRTKNRFDLTEEEHKESIRRYMAFCTYEDDLFGKVLDTLEEKDLVEDTLIIYLSDHGDYMGAHGLWAKGLPCYREAYQICTVIGGGGLTTEPKVCDVLVSLADITPTIMDVVGAKRKDLTGQSLRPFLENEVPIKWRTEIYTQTNGNELYGIQRAVWNKEWKYVYNGFDLDQLYNLEEDPLEMDNVIDDPTNQEIVREMWVKLWQFVKEHKDPIFCPYIMVSLAPYGPGISK